MKIFYLFIVILISSIGYGQYNRSSEFSYKPVQFKNLGSISPNAYQIKTSNGFSFRLKQNWHFRKPKKSFSFIAGLGFTYYNLNSDISYSFNRSTTTPYNRPSNYGTLKSIRMILNANLGIEFYNPEKLVYLQIYASPTLFGHFKDQYDVVDINYVTLPDTSYSVIEYNSFEKRATVTNTILFPIVALKSGLRFKIAEALKLDLGVSLEYASLNEKNYNLPDYFRIYLGVIF